MNLFLLHRLPATALSLLLKHVERRFQCHGTESFQYHAKEIMHITTSVENDSFLLSIESSAMLSKSLRLS